MRRRAVLAAGGAVAALAACSKYGDEGGGSAEPEPTPAASGTGKGTGDGDGGQGGGQALAKTSEIPVKGGKVFADRKVVVTQPEEGTFQAFSAVCTHQGCTVQEVSGGTINCPCHGSKFNIADASVAGGPARGPLPPQRIVVKGDSITLA